MNWRKSIYMKLIKLLLTAAVFSVAGYFLMSTARRMGLLYYCHHSDYVQKMNQRDISDLQNYISQNRVAATDTVLLTDWVKKHKPVSLQVYRDGIVVYDSAYPYYENLWKEEIEIQYYDWGIYHTMEFEDGQAEAALYGFRIYQLFNTATIVEIVLSAFIFVGVIITGIRRTMRYIRKLSSEIEILEGGDLDYEITVKGEDELSMLAKGIDDMRRSFRDQTEQEARLVQANQRLVTEMSHDLRTPLTSVMIYTEILKKHKITDEKQLRDYLEKIERQTYRMKKMADNLFEYSLIAGDEKPVMEEPEPFDLIFYDTLSETCAYLEQQGFQTKMYYRRIMAYVAVNTEYIMRIFDNTISNIVKYAAAEEAVQIMCIGGTAEEGTEAETGEETKGEETGTEQGGFLGGYSYKDGHSFLAGYAGLAFRNRKRAVDKKEDSNNIGIHNIKSMMKKMGGRCETEEDGEWFEIRVLFPEGGRRLTGNENK